MPWSYGLACALAIGATSALRAFLGAHYSYRLARMGLKLRAAITTCVFAKVLAVSVAQRGSFEGGEVQTLMSVDADRLVNLVMSLHDLWGLPLQILVALLLLYWQVSYAFLAGLAVVLLLIPVNRWLADRIGAASKQMMASKDARVQAMQELLDHMASVRAMAMEGAVLKRVNAARRQELSALAVRKYLDAWCVYFWACTPVLFSLSTFSSLLLIGRSLNAPVVFTSLALFNVLLGPLNSFPWVINGIVEALISVHRLEAFLCIPTTPTASFASAFTSSSSPSPPHTSSSSPTPSPTTAPDPSSSSKAPRSSLLHALFPVLHHLPSSSPPLHSSPATSPLTTPLLGPPTATLEQERDGQAAGCEMDGEAQSMAFDAVQPSPPLAVHVCGLSFSWHAPTSAGSQGLDQMTGASAADDGLAVDGRAGSCSTRGEDSRSTRGSSRGSSRGSQHSIALHNIWLDVPEGAVVAIVGKVGSGKSSLLAAILGEMQPVTVHAMPCTHTHGAGHGKACAHGTYRSPRSAAVLQQEPWVFSGSIRENVLFGAAWDPTRYQQVLQACALHEDTAGMVGGDDASVGDRGLNLSGGQRARLALARALYSSADLLLLDDPLSALDARVARHVSDVALFGPIAKGRTILLCTHSPRAVQRSSLVVVMQQGRIVHVAPPGVHVAPSNSVEEIGACMDDGTSRIVHVDGACMDDDTRSLLVKLLGQQRGEHCGMRDGREGGDESIGGPGDGVETREVGVQEREGAGQASVESHNCPTTESQIVGGAAAVPTAAAAAAAAAVGTEGRQEEGGPCSKGPVRDAPECSREGEEQQANAPLEEEEKRESGSVQLSVYWRYCAAVGWPLLALVLASLALMQASRNGADVTLSLWTDAVQGPGSEAAANAFYLRLFALIALLNSLFTLLRAFSFALAGMTAAHRVHHALLAAVVRAPMAFFDVNPSGRIINRFSSDLYTVDDSLPFIANILLANAFSLTGIAVLLVYTQWSFLLLLLPLAYIYSIIQRLYRQSSRELRRLDSTARSPVYAAFSLLLHGAPTIRAFSNQEHTMRGATRLMASSQQASFSEMAASQWLSVRLQLMAAVVVTFVSVTGIITGRSLPKLFLPGNTAHQALPLSPPADSHLPIPAPHLLVPGGNTSPAFSFAPDPASANITPCFSNSAHPLLPALQSFSLPALPSIPHHLSSPQSSAGSSFSLSLATWLALRPGNRSGAWAGMCSAADTSDRARGLLQELSSMPVISSIIALLRRLFSLSLFSPIRLFGSAMTTAVSSGLLGLALAYTLPIVSLLNGTLTSLADTEKDMVAVERVQEYLDLQHEPDTLAPRPLTAAREEEGKGGGDAGHAEGPGEGAAEVEGEEWPREGSVEFQHVSMAYRPGLPLALSEVNFYIPGGSQVGIAGRTGAGKSSLLAALFRLRPLTPPSTTVTKATSSSSTSGTSTTTQPRHSSSASGIFIDGVDTARVSLSALRTALAIIPQTPLIFHAPIRDNLDPEGKHADVALWEAVRKCHLEAAVGRLGGLDAMVGGAAGRLSLGERQLLCLARVMLRKSKVLCLDECTANIDGATSALMHATIAREFHGITTITIAHRVSSLLSLPRVLIFEAGALAEDGDPKNLLVNPDSRFSSLFRASI
ncbi:hypothetical protein CLOM_g8620 [Closterium sp. NIES-68]|nr:hypothetical protein CLOM_g8620 [Closterium sp. NIES-68]GJP67102.1 hypothetical protein CLOP_g23970 [Closterium sp. NIES-67]